MSHLINSEILDRMAERLSALEEVLPPPAFAAFKGHFEHLIADGEWELAEEDLTELENSQDV